MKLYKTRKPCCGRETARAVVKFDTYGNLQRHRAVLPAIAQLCCSGIGSVKRFWKSLIRPFIFKVIDFGTNRMRLRISRS